MQSGACLCRSKSRYLRSDNEQVIEVTSRAIWRISAFRRYSWSFEKSVWRISFILACDQNIKCHDTAVCRNPGFEGGT